MTSGTPSAEVRVPVGDLTFFDSPLLLTLYYLYYLGEKLSGGGKIMPRRKNYAPAEKICGGGKIMRRWKKYAAAE